HRMGQPDPLVHVPAVHIDQRSPYRIRVGRRPKSYGWRNRPIHTGILTMAGSQSVIGRTGPIRLLSHIESSVKMSRILLTSVFLLTTIALAGRPSGAQAAKPPKLEVASELTTRNARSEES